MAILPIRRYPDPVVREATKPVGEIDKETRVLIRSMIETMEDGHGVGLAANQIGVQKSIVVAELDEKPLALINPVITWYSDEKEIGEEGCLSLMPKVQIPVERSLKITVRALDRRGRTFELEAEGMSARILQHEIDHLSGLLIIDRVPEEERKKALREMSALFEGV